MKRFIITNILLLLFLLGTGLFLLEKNLTIPAVIAFAVFVFIVLIQAVNIIRNLIARRRMKNAENALEEYKPPLVHIIQGDYLRAEESRLIISEEIYELIKNEDEAFRYDFRLIFKFSEKAPSISILERDKICASYKLENFENEDFSDKYFYAKGRIFCINKMATLNFEGVVIQAPELANEELFSLLDTVIYRFETYFIDAENNEKARRAKENTRGADIDSKGLRFSGYITPANFRCVGICPECGNSFVFHSFNFPMADSQPVYSDDGLITGQITTQPTDLNNWSITLGGITFRYYNSFCCPHCGKPYIDYYNHHEFKRMGNLGCVHLGKTEVNITALSELENEETDTFKPDLTVDDIIKESKI